MAITNVKGPIAIITQPGAFQDGLKTLLAALYPGLDFRIAEGADAGLLLVKDSHPKLVLIDCSAFQDAGMEFIKHLMAENRAVKCLVFIETIHDSQLFQKIGADGFLFKGFTNQELEHTIGTLLKDTVKFQLVY